MFADWKSSLIAAAAVPFASSCPAFAEEFNSLTGKIIRLRCHMDSCEWYRIDEAKVVGTSSKGVLYELKTTTWESHHKNGKYDRPAPKTNESHGTDYFFCSKQKPAIIWQEEGKWIAAPLQPGNENAVFGATESTYTKYWAAWHHAFVDDVYAEGTRLGRKLGYRFSGDATAEEIKVGAPSDVLKWWAMLEQISRNAAWLRPISGILCGLGIVLIWLSVVWVLWNYLLSLYA